MSRFENLLARFIFRTRFYLLAVALGLTAFFAYQLQFIEFNLAPDSIFVEGDPAHTFYEHSYLKGYAYLGTPSFVALKSADPKKDLSPDLGALEKHLATNPFIKEIISPFNQPMIVPTQTGLVPESTVHDGVLTEAARTYFTENPLYQGSFLSRDDNSMALVVMIDASPQDHDRQAEAVFSIKASLDTFASTHKDIKVMFTGLPVLQYEMMHLLKTDQLTFVPLVAALMIILLLLMTRSVLGALLPLITIGIALVWSVGYLALVGHDINIVNHAIIVLIMVIGIADAVHIYTRFVDEGIKEARRALKPLGPSNRALIIHNTLVAMVTPCFLTTATTALGFGASSAAGIEIIKQFGMDTAVGVSFCYVVTFCVMPALLSLHPFPKGRALKTSSRWPKFLTIDWYLKRAVGFSLSWAKCLTALSIVAILVGAYGASDIKANQTWIGELPKNNPASQALAFIEDHFGGVMPFYVVLEGNPSILEKKSTALIINDLAQKLRESPLKPNIRSPYDGIDFLLKKMPEVGSIEHLDDRSFQELMAAAHMTAKEFPVKDVFWSKDRHMVTIQGFLNNVPTQAAEAFREHTEKLLAPYQSKELSLHLTGAAPISARALNSIVHDMMWSIALALLLISACVALVFRDVRYTVIAMLPNILPITLTIYSMKLLGIDVRMATVMIFSMALGLSIDSCIHLLSRMREVSAVKKGTLPSRRALIRNIYEAFHGSGRPIVYTTIILVGGFAVMLLSQFLALRDFALISSITLLSALVADIVLLPALLFITSKKRHD